MKGAGGGNQGRLSAEGDTVDGPGVRTDGLWVGNRLLSGAKANPFGRRMVHHQASENWVWTPSPHCLSALPPQLALRNALRYFPADVQELLAPEFAQELQLYGHIYMYRFCPDIEMRSALWAQLQRDPEGQAAPTRDCAGGQEQRESGQ